MRFMESKDWKAISKICYVAFVILSLETLINMFSQPALSTFFGISSDYILQDFSLVITRVQGTLILLYFFTGFVTQKTATMSLIEEDICQSST